MGSRGFLRRSHRTVDQWLEKMGFYRKCIARDETCLFRIVSEQFYNTQTLHARVREEVLEYMDEHRNELSTYIDTPYDDYLERLKNHLIICGNLEISVVSLLYRRDVVIFEPEDMKVTNVTDRSLSEKFLLCRTTEDHFDGIFRLDYIETAGYCQSMVYEMLYEKVFNVKDTDIIVDLMLHYDSENTIIETVNNNHSESGERLNVIKSILNERNLEYDDNTSDSLRNVVEEGVAPFSFKVAKALDPTIYRNIEFDSWNEIRKEIRYNQWYKGGEGLTEGVRCNVRLNLSGNIDNDGCRYMCYIQKIADQCKNGQFNGDEPCLVYIEELAEICTVRRDQLEPLPHAVAWPLPLKTYKNMYKETANNILDKNLRKKTSKRKILDFTTTPDSITGKATKSKTKGKKELFNTLNAFSCQEGIEYIAMPAFINHFSPVYPNQVGHVTEGWSENVSNDQQIPHNSSPERSAPTICNSEYTPTSSINTRNTTTTSSYVLVDSNGCVDYSNNRSLIPTSPGHLHPQHAHHPLPGHYEPVNYHTPRSNLTNGSDLPFHDIPTLRFFYNMGLDYFRNSAMVYPDYHASNAGDTHAITAPGTPTISGPAPIAINATSPISQPMWQQLPPVMVPQIETHRLAIDMQQLNFNDDNNNSGDQESFNKTKKLENDKTGSKTRHNNIRNNKNHITKISPTSNKIQYNTVSIPRADTSSNQYVQSDTNVTQSHPQIDFIPPHPGGYFTAHYIPDPPQGFIYGSPDILPPYMYPNCFQPGPYTFTTTETVPLPPLQYSSHPIPQSTTK